MGVEGTRLPKMTPSDDVEAFLEGFARAAIAVGWGRKEWAIQLGPLLTGPAQAVYRALSWEEARCYGKVKEAILYKLQISPETHRQKFRAKKKMKELWPRVLAQILRDAATQWIQPDSITAEEVVNLVLLEQFVRYLEVNT